MDSNKKLLSHAQDISVSNNTLASKWHSRPALQLHACYGPSAWRLVAATHAL